MEGKCSDKACFCNNNCTTLWGDVPLRHLLDVWKSTCWAAALQPTLSSGSCSSSQVVKSFTRGLAVGFRPRYPSPGFPPNRVNTFLLIARAPAPCSQLSQPTTTACGRCWRLPAAHQGRRTEFALTLRPACRFESCRGRCGVTNLLQRTPNAANKSQKLL